MTKRNAIAFAALAAAALTPAAYADQEPTVIAVAQQQEAVPTTEIAPIEPPQAAPIVEVSAGAPEPAAAPERANGCSTQRPNRQGLALVLVPFDVGRQALRSLRGIFVSC